MKISSTFKVELEADGSKAYLTFKKPPMNDLLETQVVLAAIENPLARVGEGYKSILKYLEKVEGLEDENGPITVDALKSLSMPLDIMVSIVTAYNVATAVKGEDPEKKGSKTAQFPDSGTYS